jgi:hypothetical protein
VYAVRAHAQLEFAEEMTLAQGDRAVAPRPSIVLANCSTSRVVTDATLRLPIAGETWTRCIDSQFCR